MICYVLRGDFGLATSVLMLRPIGPGAVDYYWRGPDPGHWSGRGAQALGLAGMASPETLSRVLAGRHPDTGERLGHAHPHRRAGWDLIFAAPKSVSLLAAVAPTGDSRTMSMAHREAVAETVEWIDEEIAWARRQRTRVPAGGVVAAVFEHFNNATGEPHLHTHVLLANLVEGSDGRWSALDQSSLWLERRTISGIYDLALRHQVSRHWSRLRWRLGEQGLADVVGVPREAIEAVSVRRRQVLGDLGGERAGDPSDRVDVEGVGVKDIATHASPRRTRYAAARTRVDPASTDWRTRLAQTGFRVADAAALLAPPLTPDKRARESGPSELREAAEAWLAARGSSWTRSDAIRALAATAEHGASPASTMDTVAEWCGSSPTAGPGRWTTAGARRLDESVVTTAARLTYPLPAVPTSLLTEALDRRPGLSAAASAAVRRLVRSPGPVTMLPGVPGQERLVEQATVLDAARASWEAAGIRVGLDAKAGDLARWTALSGLRESAPGEPPGVIVVDRADRRTSAELLDLLGRAEQARAKVVLVEGGTLPARREPRSTALDGLRRLEGLEGVHDRVPLPVMGADLPMRQPPAAESGRIVATATTADALATILTRWAMIPAGRRPMMVAQGPPEAEALNRLARTALVAAGEVGAGQVVIGGRAFAPGDRVLARRPGPAPSASLGTVASVTPTPPALIVRWDGRADSARVDAWSAQRLVHGYAATAGMAARVNGPLLLLGDPNQAAGLALRDVTAVVIAPTGERRRDPLDRLTRLAETARERLPVGARSAARERPPAPSTGRDGLQRFHAEPPTSLPALASRRDRLEADLRADLPPDVAGDRRLLEEDRAYSAAHPGRPGSPDPRDLERRAVQLARSEAALADWLQANGERLVRWRELGRLLDEHADLVAHATLLDPASTAQLLTGPVPSDPATHPLWQRAVRASAVHAARWPAADGGSAPALWVGSGGDPGRGSAGGLSLAELASRRRRDRAIQALDLARDREPVGRGPLHKALKRDREFGRDAGLER